MLVSVFATLKSQVDINELNQRLTCLYKTTFFYEKFFNNTPLAAPKKTLISG